MFPAFSTSTGAANSSPTAYWYDDDEFDVEEDRDEIDLNDAELMEQLLSNGGVELELNGDDDNKNNNSATASSKSTSSLRESIKDMRFVDMKNELKARRLKTSGSKKELQDRLVDDLKKEAGAS